MAFLLLRPPSPSKNWAVSSVVAPASSIPTAPIESGGSGSAKGQSALGLSVSPEVYQAEEVCLEASFPVSVTLC